MQWCEVSIQEKKPFVVFNHGYDMCRQTEGCMRALLAQCLPEDQDPSSPFAKLMDGRFYCLDLADLLYRLCAKKGASRLDTQCEVDLTTAKFDFADNTK